ncbi:MAG: hypothetical protein R3C68_09010 [Myxococcota bacterium]
MECMAACEAVTSCTGGDGCCPSGLHEHRGQYCRQRQIICTVTPTLTRPVRWMGLCAALQMLMVTVTAGRPSVAAVPAPGAPWLAVLLGMVLLRRRRRS